MESGIHKNAKGNWEMRLPLRSCDVTMPNNWSLAVSCLNGLLCTFKKKPKTKKDYFHFMEKIFGRGHTIPVPQEELLAGTQSDGCLGYFPHFGVYHPQNPKQILVVFDSSAEYQGISLNKQFFSRLVLMNSLACVLIRFRQESISLMCDIEQIFHSFYINLVQR